MSSSPSTEHCFLRAIGQPLEIVSSVLPSPLPASTAVVRMLIVDIASFAKPVFAGYGPVKPPVPYTPGTSGIGVVESIAADVFGLKEGELVMAEPVHVTESNSTAKSRLLVGWFSLSDPSQDADAAKQLALYKNGAWATRAVLPASCLHVVPSSFLLRNPSITIEDLHLVKNICISYGALLVSEFQAGDRLLVNGASGSFGGFLVLLALVLNAGRVYVMGRNEKALKQLVALDPKRVQALVVDCSSDGEKKESVVDQLKRQLGSDWQTIDRYIDFLGYSPSSTSTVSGILSLRLGGFAVLSGGVTADLPLNYGMILARELTIRGNFMYPKTALRKVLDLLPEIVDRFQLGKKMDYVAFDSLKQINEAIEAAASNAASFKCTVVYPNSKAVAKEELDKRHA